MDQNIIHEQQKNINSPRRTKAKIIKRYGNRKLYDTSRSSYVILKDIAKMIRNRENVLVIDNNTKDDITCSTLIQIIFETERKSAGSAPLNLLKAIIQTEGGSLSSYLTKIGLLRAQITDKKITIEEKRTRRNTINKTRVVDETYSTFPEKIASAALNLDSSHLVENTVLPTSKKNDLMKKGKNRK